MRSLIDRLLSVFRRRSSVYQMDDIYRVCTSASEELGSYCKAEGFSGR